MSTNSTTPAILVVLCLAYPVVPCHKNALDKSVIARYTGRDLLEEGWPEPEKKKDQEN